MKVRIILLADVKGLGRKGEIKEVSDGYAKNYLIPKKLAQIATEKSIKNLEAQKKAEEKRVQKEIEKAREISEQLNGKKITIYKPAGSSGKLFGSVTQKEISEAIKSQLGIEIDKKSVVIENPVKSTGEFEIKIEAGHGFHASVNLTVEPESR